MSPGESVCCGRRAFRPSALKRTIASRNSAPAASACRSNSASPAAWRAGTPAEIRGRGRSCFFQGFAPAWSALSEAMRPRLNSQSGAGCLTSGFSPASPTSSARRSGTSQMRPPNTTQHACQEAAPSGARAATRACARHRRPTPHAAPPPAPPRTRRGARPAARAARSGAPRASARAAPCRRPRCKPRCRSARTQAVSAAQVVIERQHKCQQEALGLPASGLLGDIMCSRAAGL